MYLRCYTEKIGQFELLEPKNLCYTSSNFTYWNYFLQEPVNIDKNWKYTLTVEYIENVKTLTTKLVYSVYEY